MEKYCEDDASERPVLTVDNVPHNTDGLRQLIVSSHLFCPARSWFIIMYTFSSWRFYDDDNTRHRLKLCASTERRVLPLSRRVDDTAADRAGSGHAGTQHAVNTFTSQLTGESKGFTIKRICWERHGSTTCIFNNKSSSQFVCLFV